MISSVLELDLGSAAGGGGAEEGAAGGALGVG